jgi:tetratricopeptide (TPR) repeat protein
LRGVVENARKFLDADNAETALEILLVILEEAGDGIEYIDDSNGELGGFMSEVGEPLAEAILSLESSAVERARLIERLNKLSKRLGDYGVDGAIPIALKAAKYGWKDTLQESSESDNDEDEEWEDDEANDESHGYESYVPEIDFTDVKLNILARHNRNDEFLTLAKKEKKYLRYVLTLCDLKRVPEAIKFAEKHLKTADEARAMAEKLRELKHFDEAIAIAERGLDLAPPKAQLGTWLGPVQESRGEHTRAFDAWFAAFAEQPSLDVYKTLKRLTENKWDETRPQVMGALKKSHYDQVIAEVHLFEEEWDEAIKIADKRDVWYEVTATVADAVIEHRPEWVIQISIKQAEELIGRTQSKYYVHAADWLARAKKAYKYLEWDREWRVFLDQLKEKYKRRPALQGYLRRL